MIFFLMDKERNFIGVEYVLQEENIEKIRLNRNSEASEVYERVLLWRVGKGSIHRD